MAELMNEEGNKHYKEGNLIQAGKCYQQAANVEQSEPKYLSNLSAVLYELGRYQGCVKTILAAWTRLRARDQIQQRPSTLPFEADPLAIKLATRFAKANINAFANRTASVHKRMTSNLDIETDIKRFAMLEREEFAELNGSKLHEMKEAWNQFQGLQEACAQHTEAECGKIISAAEQRLRDIPIFCSSMCPTLEYFKIGHDDVRSMIFGLNGSPMDIYNLELDMEEDQWRFLFGGSGDARHVFGTIIHFRDIGSEFGFDDPLDRCSLHMTLIDIHPATLARVIVIFSLLQQILVAEVKRDKQKIVELHTALYYLYTSMVMPDYCGNIIIDTCKTLVEDIPKGRGSLMKCLHVNQKSIPAILEVLKSWAKPLQKSSALVIERNPRPTNPFFRMLEDRRQKEYAEDMTRNLHSPRTNALFNDPYTNPDAELNIFNHTRVLLPPRSLLPRHPALFNLVKSYLTATESQYLAAKTEVERSWVPNPTMFDLAMQKPGTGLENGYPVVPPDSALKTLSTFVHFTEHFDEIQSKSSSGCSGFVASSRFFGLLANALSDIHSAITIELIVGDVITSFPKLLKGDLGKRPKNFPTTYSRMFLSNVPDYTHGPLNTAIHLVPHLETEGLAICNCLLNTGAFSTIADYCYNFTLLLPKDLPRFLGCEILNSTEYPSADIAVKTLHLPRSLGTLASKKELHTWLTQLLLCIVCKPSAVLPPLRVNLPANLNCYLRVLVHLYRVGFPAHWIGDFLQSVISDNLVTDVVPYIGTTPIPRSYASSRKSHRRKIHLDAWQAEFEVLLASTMCALPFAIDLPMNYPTVSDIKTFKATVIQVNLEHHPRLRKWQGCIQTFVQSVGLLFLKPTASVTADALARVIPAILEGDSEARQGVQFFLGQESVDCVNGEISWKMSVSWYQKMCVEGWSMSAYRSDLNVAVTKPVKSNEWVQLST